MLHSLRIHIAKKMSKKKPDLTFEREFGDSSEGIELFTSDDGFLEIQGWNCDSDSFTIILSPDEIDRLRNLLIFGGKKENNG